MNALILYLSPVLPEIFLCSMACAILIVDLFLSERRRGISYLLTQLALIGAALLTLWGDTTTPIAAFNEMFVSDELSTLLKLSIYIVTFFVFAYSRDYLQSRAMYRGEYFVLGLFGVIGMMVMASASHFLTLYLGLELMSLSLYAMVAFQRDSATATEAAMKYFVLGAMASGILLYGMSILYGVTGSLQLSVIKNAVGHMAADDVVLLFGLVFIVVGVAFKLGAIPFHMWVPDVYQGAPTAVTLFVGTAPKLAAFALVVRLLVDGLESLSSSWQDMLIVIAILSMALGNVIAIAQENLKRMLAYSSISHMGFFLLGILSATPNGYSASLFYILIYAVMSLGSFGMIILLSRKGFEAERLDDLKGLNQRSPWHALLMLILMFSMTGVPPTAGFYAKLLVIQATIDVGLIWLAILAVLFTVIGAYYYLRVIKLMYFDNAVDTNPVAAPVTFKVLLGVNVILLIAVMPWVGVVIDWCTTAIQGLG